MKVLSLTASMQSLLSFVFKGMTTAAFVPHLLRYIIESKAKADDPLLLCLSPTRELAVQVENEAHKFGTSVAA